MPDLTQLRLPDEPEFSWYALDRTVDRPLGCHNCNRRIDPGEPHARGDEGQRLCQACVSTCTVGAWMPTAEANRRRREVRIEHAMEAGARMLLDGLEVETIGELKALVDATRSPMARYAEDRSAKMSTAIGIARMALDRGDAVGAKRELDDVCDELHRMLFDALVAEGHDPEKVAGLIGARERTRDGA